MHKGRQEHPASIGRQHIARSSRRRRAARRSSACTIFPGACRRVRAAARAALLACLAAAALAPRAVAQESSADKQSLATYYGFGDMEVYKLDDDITHLRTADMNGDGHNDMIVVNNTKSKIEVLLQRTEEPGIEPVESDDPNELHSHWRFRHEWIPINYRVWSLAVGELSGDALPDIVFYGEPKELVVLVNNGDGTFQSPVTQRIREGVLFEGSLAVGDLNSDQRADVALLGDKDVFLFYQEANGGLARPQRAAHALGQPYSVDIADIDGDGRSDLVLVSDDPQYPLRVRLQVDDGALGPQRQVRSPLLRSWHLLPCLGRKQADLFAVESISGRLKRWSLDPGGTPEASEEWAVEYYPFPSSETVGSRPVAVGDVTGDGRADLVAADVKAAQLLLYEQTPRGGLHSPQKFGGQINIRDLRLHDLDGDGLLEVFACSADEKSIGVSRWQQNRLNFPAPLPIEGEPQAFDLAGPAEGVHRLAYVVEEDGSYHLVSMEFQVDLEDGRFRFNPRGQSKKLAIEDFNTAPSAVRWVDVNHDDRLDVLIFAPYETLVTFIQDASGQLARLRGPSAQEGLVHEARIEGFAVADINKDGRPEVILAQKSFARALKVDETGQWVVVDQFNAPTSSAEIAGVAVVPAAADEPAQIALYDNRGKEIHWLSANAEGLYTVTRSTPIGSFELNAMLTARLAKGPRGQVVLSDTKKFGVILPQQPALQVKELGVYETKTKMGQLLRVAAGDLNHDGRTDLAVTEVTENRIEVLTYDAGDDLVLATKFKVFDTKQFQHGGGEENQPSEVAIADLNGDGNHDLAVIVHDRVIVYPAQ